MVLRLESDALGAQTSLRSSRAGVPLRSCVVRAERAGGARLGRTLLVQVQNQIFIREKMF